MHCTLLPIKDGRFAYKEIFAGKDKFEYSARMKQLHTDFSPRSTRSGEWERTERRRDRRTAQDDGRIPPYALGRMYHHWSNRFSIGIGEVLSALHSDIRLAERRVKGLTSMVENLKKGKSEKRLNCRHSKMIWIPGR